jgi:hypothetical protein
MTLNPVCENVETKQGVPLTVTGVAQVKMIDYYSLHSFRFLCTGAFLYAPYSFLLISNIFWMGEGCGGAVRLCYLTTLEGGMSPETTRGLLYIKPPMHL